MEKFSTIQKKSFFLTFLIAVETALSFGIRINFWPFVDKLGLYQGDLWYFFTYYGNYFKTYNFFPIEYPAGYVVLLKINYFFSNLFGGFTYLHFIYANELLMVPLSIATAILIYKISEKLGLKKNLALLYLLLSPTFFIASTTNYDLYPVFFTLLAVFLLLHKKIFLSFLSLGIGTAIKLYPGFLVPLFIFYLLKRMSKRRIFKGFLGFIISVLSINIPFFLYSASYWIFPYKWQSQNPQKNDPNTISYFLQYLHQPELRLPFFGLIVLISVLISFIIYKRGVLNSKAFIYLCYLTCFSAVFGNQVNTPQYTLWFLPFVAITAIPALPLWWIGDAINSTILFFYFQLSYHHIDIKLKIFSFMTVFFLALYLYLLYGVYKIYSQREK